MVEFPTITFLVVEDLFDRYTIVVNETTNDTSVYCEECGIWVNTYSGNQLTTVMPDDLYEMIVDDHEHQVKGVPVEIADSGSGELL
jgi:methionine salvage enolase-phosphatase E1